MSRKSGNRFSDNDMRKAKKPPQWVRRHGRAHPQSLPTASRVCLTCAPYCAAGRSRVAWGGPSALRYFAPTRASDAPGASRPGIAPSLPSANRAGRLKPVNNQQNPPTGPNDFCRNRQASLDPRRGTYVAAEGDVGGKWGAYWSSWGAARFRLESQRWFWGSCPDCVVSWQIQLTVRVVHWA